MSDLRKEFTENAEQFASLMVEMLSLNERLYVLAVKHCPRSHPDFQKLLELADNTNY